MRELYAESQSLEPQTVILTVTWKHQKNKSPTHRRKADSRDTSSGHKCGDGGYLKSLTLEEETSCEENS